MATNSNQTRSLESRRQERRRREKRRKKRVRALLLLILLIAVIVLIIIAFASCSGRNTDNNGITGSNAIETMTPEDSIMPTATPDSSLPSVEDGNDLLKVIQTADAQGGEKTCYLTFDDGPSENVTPAVLDTLRRYNVKATFFELGAGINSNPDIARRVYEEGHLIANHSNGHNYETLYATAESFMNEIQMAETAIEAATGGDHKFKLFRFPGGSYNAGDHAAEKQEYKELLRINGFFYVDWDSLTGDAEGKTKNAQELLEYLKSNLDTDSSTVILMHDAAAKTATAEALPLVIEYLLSEGYTFKRLDEMPTVIRQSIPTSADGGTYSDDYTSGSQDYDYDTQGYDYSSQGYSSYDGTSSDYNSQSSSSSYSGTSGGTGSILSTPSSGTTTRTSVNGTSVTE